MQQAIAGEPRAVARTVKSINAGEAAASLFDNQRRRCKVPKTGTRLSGNFRSALGYQAVNPEVSIAA